MRFVIVINMFVYIYLYVLSRYLYLISSSISLSCNITLMDLCQYLSIRDKYHSGGPAFYSGEVTGTFPVVRGIALSC